MTQEELIIYGVGLGFSFLIILVYVRIQARKSKIIETKIEHAKTEGKYEPVSLYPFIDPDICIGGAACVAACPEKDIIGIVNGKGALINASNCVGHGACFHACPVEAISLKIGTEKRGVDLPHVNQNFETNVKGIFIAGELGGMGLIKNSVNQGKQAVDNLVGDIDRQKYSSMYDLVIVGAGPAGISAALQAKKRGLHFLLLEQDSLGGTVYNFPREKVVMTSPMDLPGYGKLKLFETNKDELLKIWQSVLGENQIEVQENTRVNQILKKGEGFVVETANNQKIETAKVLLAIGRRGSPRKLNIEGEGLTKVAYRLVEPELIINKDILIVGGGDSAVESALLLAEKNQVTVSYRGETFARIKPKNLDKIKDAMAQKKVQVLFQSELRRIDVSQVFVEKINKIEAIQNDLVYIFAGGELPTQFLINSGIEITKRFGYTIKSHEH